MLNFFSVSKEEERERESGKQTHNQLVDGEGHKCKVKRGEELLLKISCTSTKSYTMSEARYCESTSLVLSFLRRQTFENFLAEKTRKLAKKAEMLFQCYECVYVCSKLLYTMSSKSLERLLTKKKRRTHALTYANTVTQ